MFIADEKRSHPKGRRREGSLARFPLGWNYPSDKKSPKSKMLEQVLIANGCQLFGEFALALARLALPKLAARAPLKKRARTKRKRDGPAFRRSAAFVLLRLSRRSVGENPTSGEIGGRAQHDDGDHANRRRSVACQFENRAHNFLLQSHLAPGLDSCRHFQHITLQERHPVLTICG